MFHQDLRLRRLFKGFRGSMSPYECSLNQREEIWLDLYPTRSCHRFVTFEAAMLHRGLLWETKASPSTAWSQPFRQSVATNCEQITTRFRHEASHAIDLSVKRGLCWTTYLSILRVRVKFGNRVFDTYALLEMALLRDDFATEMAMFGTSALINFGTFHGSDPLLASRTVEFELLAPQDDSVRFEVTTDTTLVLYVTGMNFRRSLIRPIGCHPDVDHGEVKILIG